MSGHLRFGFAAFFLLLAFATPAASNPFTDFFSLNPAPAEATAPAPAEEGCLPHPGKTAADGLHWVYRYDGHRKCWFQAAEGTASVKKHRHAAKHRVAAPKEKESALRSRKAVVDARAELPSSPQAETPQPTAPAPELKVVDAASVPGAAALVPPAPVVAKPATDQLTPEPTPRQVDVKTLLAAAPAASDEAASVPPGAPVAVPTAKVGDDGGGWTVTWLGVLVMALGLISLLSSSRTLRRALLAARGGLTAAR